MADFVMPSLGADMEAGVFVGWLKQPGERVRRGDVIAEVETDKGIIEVEAFADGTLEQILVEPGQKVPVGTVLAKIREEGAPKPGTPKTPAEPTPSAGVAPGAPTLQAPQAPAEAAGPTESAGARRPASPAARRLAQELGIDPGTVQGSGPGRAVTREDVQRAAGARQPEVSPPVAPASAQAGTAEAEAAADRLRRMRQTITAAMSRSKREIPHYYLGTTIDLHRAMGWLTDVNEKRPVTDRLLYGALLLKATALALREVPELNAVWEGDRVDLREEIHLGVAISLRQGGLVAPALHNADRHSLDELMKNLRYLTQRARAGRLRSSELADGTITVTSLGERGVESVFGIIYPPQVAIVGFGKVVERPWSVGGQIVSRPVVTATLSADHRVSDGHRGGLFLNAIDRLLQEPEKL